MLEGQRFSFTERRDSLGRVVVMPYLPIILTYRDRSIEVMALLDTGASVNVLPYQVGVQLEAVWENQTVSVPLSGNLAHSEARGLIISGSISSFSPLLLAFAWTQLQDVPVILGQMNFFMEFNVCFYRYDLAFEICPRERKL